MNTIEVYNPDGTVVDVIDATELIAAMRAREDRYNERPVCPAVEALQEQVAETLLNTELALKALDVEGSVLLRDLPNLT